MYSGYCNFSSSWREKRKIQNCQLKYVAKVVVVVVVVVVVDVVEEMDEQSALLEYD